MHFLLTLLFLVILFRLVLRALGFGRWRRHRYYRGGWGNGFNNGYGYGGGPFGYGPRRGGGLLTILALVALDRLFTRRF